MKKHVLLSFLIIGSWLTACSTNTIQPQKQSNATQPAQKKIKIVKKRGVAKKTLKKQKVVTRSRPKQRRTVTRVVKKRITPQQVYRRQATRPKTVKPKPRYTQKKQKTYTPRKVYRQHVAKRPVTAPRRYVPVKRKVVYRPRKRIIRHQARPRARTRTRAPVRRITRHYPKPAARRAYPSASFARSLSNAAVARTRQRVRYDGKYVKIGYPWGDVPANIGVCTDVVIRSYRRLGIDLQKAVHEDMSKGGFYDYPRVKKWKLSGPDRNIDHRRVYNLQAFFRRHGAQVPITRNPRDYRPGDLVTWMVGPSLPHIGVVVEQRSKTDPRRHMIVHNIAYGPQMEDVLFRFPITGHYRYNKNNRLVAPRRYPAKKYVNKNIAHDYNRIMRELSRAPRVSRKSRRTRRTPPRNPRGTMDMARLKSESGISDQDIQALLGR